MIARLTGILCERAEDVLIIDVHGVGYAVHVSAYTCGKLPIDEMVTLQIYTHVREQVLELYGFLLPMEKDVFLALLDVSGIGPKAGLALLSAMDPCAIVQAVCAHDAEPFTRVSGVGKKTAERIVIDLQTKAKKIADRYQCGGTYAPETLREENETIDALIGLGYTQAEARMAVERVDATITDPAARITAALRLLGKKRI